MQRKAQGRLKVFLGRGPLGRALTRKGNLAGRKGGTQEGNAVKYWRREQPRWPWEGGGGRQGLSPGWQTPVVAGEGGPSVPGEESSLCLHVSTETLGQE